MPRLPNGHPCPAIEAGPVRIGPHPCGPPLSASGLDCGRHAPYGRRSPPSSRLSAAATRSARGGIVPHAATFSAASMPPPPGIALGGGARRCGSLRLAARGPCPPTALAVGLHGPRPSMQLATKKQPGPHAFACDPGRGPGKAALAYQINRDGSPNILTNRYGPAPLGTCDSRSP
jgi:hypothetical protein